MSNRAKDAHGDGLVALAPFEQRVDVMIDGYVNWREACAMVAASYENWKHAEVGLWGTAFKAYAAALDREEQVARNYQLALEHVASGPAA